MDVKQVGGLSECGAAVPLSVNPADKHQAGVGSALAPISPRLPPCGFRFRGACGVTFEKSGLVSGKLPVTTTTPTRTIGSRKSSNWPPERADGK